MDDIQAFATVVAGTGGAVSNLRTLRITHCEYPGGDRAVDILVRAAARHPNKLGVRMSFCSLHPDTVYHALGANSLLSSFGPTSSCTLK